MKKCAVFLALSALSAMAFVVPSSAQERMVVAQAAAQKVFHGKGKITGLDAGAGFVTIAHEDIPGLMDAMEMQFEAKPASILKGLKVGDKVDFAIEGKTYKLLEIAPAK
jgi:Cu(I)/Ag(I) efflux system periplasmic protein CusF